MKKNKETTKARKEQLRANSIYRTCFKPTSDYWGPSYRLANGSMLVETTLMSTPSGSYVVHIAGQDDTRRQKWFTEEQKEDAIALYNKVLDLPFVDFVKLDELGVVGE